MRLQKIDLLKKDLSTRPRVVVIVFNDTFQHLAALESPARRDGYQFLRYSFDAFTHLRSFVDIPKGEERNLSLRYPSYRPDAYQVLGRALNMLIPEENVLGVQSTHCVVGSSICRDAIFTPSSHGWSRPKTCLFFLTSANADIGSSDAPRSLQVGVHKRAPRPTMACL
ncbi:hypothetical protein EDC04DRAFT_966893 [Pisolithus marmoratus]|nr:hypothetical protein EDC04DRAFT_966893 [Pisolithus marmoratus]